MRRLVGLASFAYSSHFAFDRGPLLPDRGARSATVISKHTPRSRRIPRGDTDRERLTNWFDCQELTAQWFRAIVYVCRRPLLDELRRADDPSWTKCAI